ncbi:MAG: PAS domain S-box protein [Streptococcus sp.]|jgi:PAS domain S-box-containing protein|nr:PAS domain S-box protein [Streptococcus sp.]
MLQIGFKRRLGDDYYKQLFTTLLDAIPSSVLLINPEMRIVSANRNFLNKSRRTELNTHGFRLEEVFPPGILDHLNIAQRIIDVFKSGSPTLGAFMTYRTPGLPMRFYYYKVIPFCYGKEVEQALLLMDDVTDKVRLSDEVRRIQHHLASVVESASDIVLSTDTAGRILTWNSAAERLSLYTLNQVHNRFFSDYSVEWQREEIKQAFRALQGGSVSWTAEWSLLTAKGNHIPVSWVCSPMKDNDQLSGIVAVGRDLTERRKFESQLFQSQKLAALGVMAGGIAHEIRNPLAICSSAAQFILEEDIAPDFRKECALKIQSAIQKASQIIENLLRFARPSAPVDRARLDLAALLSDTLALINHQARIQKVEVRYCPPASSILIQGIAGLLQQLFMNLCLNAINAMPDGGLLDVQLYCNTADGQVVVRIADTGQGIAEPDLSQIFDPFYTTSAVGKGTGLGLSICYSIIKQHAGSIDVESQVDRGSVFTVRFPSL